MEDTFKRINSHKGVEGIIVVSKDGIPIRTTLDPEITVQYAALVTRFTEKSKSVLTEVNGEVRDSRPQSVRDSLSPALAGRQGKLSSFCLRMRSLTDSLSSSRLLSL